MASISLRRAHTDRQRAALFRAGVQQSGLLHAPAHHLAQRPRARCIAGRQGGDKLVAAIARRDTVLAHRLSQHVRHATQHFIANLVAEAVVDALEAVDVDPQHRERLAFRHAIGETRARQCLEFAPVA